MKIMSNGQKTEGKRPLPDLNANLREDIHFLMPIAIGVTLGIFGNMFVNATFELLRNVNGSSIPNDLLIGILILSFGIILIPSYYIYHNMVLIRQRSWGSSICTSGSQRYTIGETFSINGTCPSLQNNVTIKLFTESQFHEKPLPRPILEFNASIEDDYQYHYTLNTTGLEPGLYRLMAINNDSGKYSTANIILIRDGGARTT
jgi:hypothetical protein